MERLLAQLGTMITEDERRSLGIRKVVRDNRLTALKISKKKAAHERDLDQTKWFDYRFMTPMEATEKFANAYQEEFKDRYAKNIDTEEAEGRTGTRGRDWKSNSREFNSFWSARQFADELGVPYGHFVHYAMRLLLRWGWQHIPRPNQLYGDEVRAAVGKEVLERWAEWSAARFTFSELPQYLVENFRGSPAQIAHREWVIEQLKQRNGRLGSACFTDRVLPVDLAVSEFGSDKVDDARSYTVGSPKESIVIGSDQTMPSCHGVLHSYDLSAGQCGGCAAQGTCAGLTSHVRDFVIARTNSDDPIEENRLRLQRDRTSKCRRKAAAVAAKPGTARTVSALSS
jgi:hypothetical protein